MRTVSLSSVVVLIGACSGPPAPMATSPRVAPPAPAPLAGDTTITTPTGATLVAPKGWWLSESGGAIALADPDRAVTATIIATPEADPAAAIAAAWQRVRPGFARAIRRSAQPPPRRGWQANTEVDYDTGAGEHRVVRASARRYRETTYVALVEGDAAAAARRGAQLETALGTLTPPGMRDESFAGIAPRPIDAARAAALDAFIAGAQARLAVPGAAVAVIAGGKVVYERSVGVRALGRREPITPRTLFLLASVTKPMTTLMQAALVDAGTLTWDTPVTQLLPGFALGDPEVTRKLRLWHMSCACSGMPRRDLDHIFEFAGVTAEARVASMKTMTPTTGFGDTYQYSNLMVAAGGFAAAHAADPDQRPQRRRLRATPLQRRVKRKVLELLFDGADVASTGVAYYVTSQREAAAAAQLGLDRAPDVAWQRGLAGRYRNPSLGVVELRAGSPLGTFDAGEWQLRFGRRVASDGTVKLVFVDPPFAGGELVVGGDAAHPTLTVPYGQVGYVFERAR